MTRTLACEDVMQTKGAASASLLSGLWTSSAAAEETATSLLTLQPFSKVTEISPTAKCQENISSGHIIL